MYSRTPLFSKAPVWQGSLAASQSLCEFTVSKFSKRKQFSNSYYSPSFYTHPQDYKICLKVAANGDLVGKGTRVSVYSHLMRGSMMTSCSGHSKVILLLS